MLYASYFQAGSESIGPNEGVDVKIVVYSLNIFNSPSGFVFIVTDRSIYLIKDIDTKSI